MNLKENAKKGRQGEILAENFIKNLGYKVIERNWHYSKNAEIDIIASDNSTLVFIEVKTRSSLAFGHPFEAINKNKLQKLYTAIYGYMKYMPQKYKTFRLDGIAVIGLDNPRIEHLKNIGQF